MSDNETRLYSFTVDLDNALDAARIVGRLQLGHAPGALAKAVANGADTRDEVIAQYEALLPSEGEAKSPGVSGSPSQAVADAEVDRAVDLWHDYTSGLSQTELQDLMREVLVDFLARRTRSGQPSGDSR